MRVFQLEPADYEKYKVVAVTEEQSQFVYPVDRVLRELAAEPAIPYGIEGDGIPVGVFVLDWSDAPRSVTLKSLQIDRHAQRRGYAKGAIESIKRLARGRVGEIRLTVNIRNVAAYQLYRAAGFVALDALYRGGPSGPQYVMVYDLTPRPPGT